jgi:transposase
MKAYSEEARNEVLEFLRQQRSRQEISKRTGIPVSTIEDWAAEWRTEGSLVKCKRDGFNYSIKAKQMSNGYYKCIRKRYNGMKWTDKLAGRVFGFKSPIEAIPYYLKNGHPRPCAYCGRIPEQGRVWGLDRIDSTIGHVPGNLVPACSSHYESPQLSCQTSKSSFTLLAWMERNMSRANGAPVPFRVVKQRLEKVYTLAAQLKDAALAAEKETHNA